MGVYFVYRSDALSQLCERYVRRFADATLIDWFRRHWRPIVDWEDGHQYANELLGVSIPYAGVVFATIAERGLQPPAILNEVRQLFQQTGYFTVAPDDGEEHAFQALADDGDRDSVVYLFDDDFAQRHPERTAFLLADWPLPDAAGASTDTKWESSDLRIEQLDPVLRGRAEGRVYSFANLRQYRLDYTDLNAGYVDLLVGLRLPELCRRLMRTSATDVDECVYLLPRVGEALLTENLTDNELETAFIRSLREEPDDEATWRAYSDWLIERGDTSPGARLLRLAAMRLREGDEADPSRNVVHVGEHVAQCRLHRGGDNYLEWFVFDDLWGAAHPVLADSLLRYCTRWDVLTSDTRKADPP
jgi:uncharacterized protein (TIGR02996 family)